MALEDLAFLVAPKRPQNALKILRAFYPKNEPKTKEDLVRETGLKIKTLQYYFTKLKRWKILCTKRRWLKSAVYYLDHRGFHARVDTVFCDPLKNLINFGLWDASERPKVQPSLVQVRPESFIPTSTGRCHSCDTITKTNNQNVCQVCFEENGGASHA